MSTKWQPTAGAPLGVTLIIAIQVYNDALDIYETKVTTGKKSGLSGAYYWRTFDYVERDTDIIAWQPLPDFTESENPN